MFKSIRKLCFAAALFASAGLGHAMSIDGAGTIVVVPLFANTPSFTSEVTIFNPNGSSVDIAPNFVGMDGRVTVGRVNCTIITVPANTSVQYSLPALCPAINPGSNNGKLTLISNSAANLPFFAYARIQTLAGQGFSVEGFPIGSFEGGLAVATGLKRIAAAPTFQSNCAVSSMNEPVDYTLQLQTSTGLVLGNTLSGSLTANQMTAFIDIFAAVNAPPGDHTNVRALIVNSNPAPAPGSAPSLLGFCTVQDNASLGADFRMAKIFNPKDESKQRANTVSLTRLGTSFQFSDVNRRNTHVIYLRHPDYLSCVFATGAADVMMRLLDPQNNVMVSGATVTGFTKFPIGSSNLIKSATNDGVSGRWLIEVQTLSTSTTLPASYSITCQSGNGHTMLDLIDTTQPRYVP